MSVHVFAFILNCVCMYICCCSICIDLCFYRSNLASLFGSDISSNGDGNKSLIYSAPKQPNKNGAVICYKI